MSPKEQSDLDQSHTYFTEQYPVSLFRFYSNCVKEGFSVEQAFKLTRTWWRQIWVNIYKRK